MVCAMMIQAYVTWPSTAARSPQVPTKSLNPLDLENVPSAVPGYKLQQIIKHQSDTSNKILKKRKRLNKKPLNSHDGFITNVQHASVTSC